MQVIHPRCCGLEVHQKSVAACVLACQENGRKHKEVRTFGTWTQDLQRLAAWNLVAKRGGNMDQFPALQPLASRAG